MHYSTFVTLLWTKIKPAPFFSSTESIPVHKNVTSVLQLQSKSREHEASDARSASDVNTGLTDVLSKRPEFQQLSISEQEELMVTLYDDEKSMRRQFGKLVVKACDSVEEWVQVVKFAEVF